MESRAKLFGHPVHQMLIVFPLGLLTTALLFDVVHLATGNALWSHMSFWLIVVGVLTGLLAALGYVDWKAIPSRTRAKRIGALHGGGNMVVLFLFGLSCLMRIGNPGGPEAPALVLAFAGGGLSLVTAWLGGELVDRLAIGVDDGAHADAPNSMGRRIGG